MAVSPNPVFKFNGQSFSVKVENIAPSATRAEILKVFTTLIGDVRRCDEYFDGAKRRVFELEFPTSDAAKKALCMTGYTIAGAALTVSTTERREPYRQPKEPKHGDNRRNLYVLGLPFDLTKSEFMDIFSRYGNVCHAVILATVDNASRRRGFVVMGSHKDAKFAMDSLSRTDIKGHIIDVSWAVVQRSQGFLDGGDRTMMLSQQAVSSAHAACHTLDLSSSPNSPGLTTPPVEIQVQQIPPPSCPVPTLLVTNLPSILFSQADDLHPLLCPFGEIIKLEIRPNEADAANLSVLVEYNTAGQAKEARDALHGQCYTSRPVNVEYVQPNSPEPACWPLCKLSPKTGLNPMAPPFFGQWKYCPDDLDALLCEPATYTSADDAKATKNGTPRMDSMAFYTNTHASNGLYGTHLLTHRPHSAPSQISCAAVDVDLWHSEHVKLSCELSVNSITPLIASWSPLKSKLVKLKTQKDR